ncbi:MAG: DUF2207 domain-containing protein, partial [Propionibacteriales bacterium]|nr:DUF2207 domain-containing protein [Propionibacteriales bacterium]
MSAKWIRQGIPRHTGRQQRAWMVASLVAVLVVLLTAAGPTSAVVAEEDSSRVQSYQGTVRVEKDGSLHVAETVTYDFGGTPTSTVRRDIVTRENYDSDHDRVYELSNVAVDAGQADVAATVTASDEVAAVVVEFAVAQSDAVTMSFDYDVAGAVAQTADGLEVRWPVVQGFDRPIASARVQWNANGVVWLSCLAGPSGSSRPCTTSQLVDASAPTMEQRGLATAAQMVGILGLRADSGVSPSTDLQARRSIARSFTATGAPLGVAVAVLLVGLGFPLGLWLSRGRDKDATRSPVVRPLTPQGDRMLFSPPSAVRPGQMGTLVDERANVVDVSSTIVDLAVRNY